MLASRQHAILSALLHAPSKGHMEETEKRGHTVQDLPVYPVVLAIHEYQAPPHKREDQPAVPRWLHEGVAVRLKHLLVRLGADNQNGIAVEKGEVANHMGLGPLAHPVCIRFDWGARPELAEGLAEEEVVVLGSSATVLVYRLDRRDGAS